MNMDFVAVHWSRCIRFHGFISFGINKVCGGPRIWTVAAVTSECRDTPLRDKSLRAPGKVSRNANYESCPTTVIMSRRCATECRADGFTQFWKPAREATPVTTKRITPTLNVFTIGDSKKVCLNRLVAYDPIRLSKPWQQTHGQAAQLALEAAHGDSQRLLSQSGQPAFVIPQST